jgi:SPASM domain peptide maturase of grasp-with-spasm system
MTEVFKTVAECIPVKGAQRSILYDLSRRTYDFIPNALCDILLNDGKTKTELEFLYGKSTVLDQYFHFLLEREYIFLCAPGDALRFPALDLSWAYPSEITSAVVVLDDNTAEDLISTLYQLEAMGCRHMLWLCRTPGGIEKLELLLPMTQTGTILSIEILSLYGLLPVEMAEQFIDRYVRIRAIVLHSAPVDRMHSDPIRRFGLILFSKDAPELHGDQRAQIRKYFHINLDLFSESQQHNTFYNRKVFIGAQGGIYNSPDWAECYGFISNTHLTDAIEKQGFKKNWFIHKEKIAVCKQCEFRHMCVDNRIPLAGTDSWHHGLECFYNPFTATWKE